MTRPRTAISTVPADPVARRARVPWRRGRPPTQLMPCGRSAESNGTAPRMGETVASDGGVLQSAMEGVDGTPVLDLKPLLERTRESQ